MEPGISTPQAVRLRDVARLAADAQITMPAAERLLRKGPYPLYAENCTVSRIDDYALEAGGTVLVGAFGQVLASTGFLLASYEPGRCSTTEHVHAVVPHDSADGRYLWRVISASSRAAHLVVGTSQLRQLAGPALMSVPIPWPERSVREEFVAQVDAFEVRAAELARVVPDLLAQGDRLYAELVLSAGGEPVPAPSVAQWRAGTDVPASMRGASKPVRVEGPRGVLGRCDEALTSGPIVAVGPSGRHLLAHYVAEPCHPIAEMRHVDAGCCQVPLPVLLFALRAAGLPDRLRVSGRASEARVLSLAELDDVALVLGTPEAQVAFAERGAAILDQIVAAERELDELAAVNKVFVDDFVNGMTFHGEPLTVAEPPAAPQSPGRDSLGNGSRRDALGPLADLAAAGSFGLEAADEAWELAPLAAMRAVAPERVWAPVAEAAAPGEGPDHAGLISALDAAMEAIAEDDDLLAFLPNLSYTSSLLSLAQLAALVRGLDVIGPDAIDGAHVRAVFALGAPGAGLPKAVAEVVRGALEGVSARLPAGWETAYVPWESQGDMVELIGRAFPAVTLRAQFDEFAHMLETALVRAVDLRRDRSIRGGLGAVSGSALAADEFADWKAPLVAAVLPPNQGAWSAGPVVPDDPRWSVLGVPARNKANYAWIQHALFHQADGGATVLLVANAMLHAASGREYELREALAASGRVRAVVSFPARIFGDGRPATSLLVLGDSVPQGEKAGCLMVDGLGLGRKACGDALERELPASDAARMARACRAWLAGEDVPNEPGFARVVDRADIVALGGMLTPWSYV